ncbi:MAG: hypothetical protein H6828_04165 [Planctomycetes bacterium]|nr:hypothetical protein [Planctomycetota bacterium]
MTRWLVGLALVTALLALALRGAAPREVASAAPFARLVTADEAAALSIAGLSLEDGASGERFVYAQEGGVWRCVSAYGALGLASRIEELAGEVLDARGPWRADDPARDAAFGLAPDQRLVVRLHGARMFEDPGGDVLLAVELGASLPGVGGGRAFARRAGTRAVLEIDHDPRRLVARSAGDLPPLLDARLLAGEFPARGAGLARAFVDLAGGEALVLRSEVREVPGLERAEWPREWTVSAGEARATCLPYRIAGWQAFLYRVEWRGLSDPEAAPRRGLAEPRATLTLAQVDGDPIVLQVGQPAPSGGCFVLNEKTGQLGYLGPEEAALVVPTLVELCDPGRANPWERWLPR